jgi:hypothetical protein
MKTLFLSLLIGISLIAQSVNATETTSTCTAYGKQVVDSKNQRQPVKLVEKEGPLCSDGSRCDPKYKYCCDIKGVPTCVYRLSDCHE